MQKLLITLIILASGLLLAGCDQSHTVQTDDQVTIIYTGSFTDGTLFQNGEKTITIGKGDMPIGIEENLLGKRVGKTFQTTISPKKGFVKQHLLTNIQKINKIIFDQLNIDIAIGKQIKIDKVEGVILGIENDDQGNPFVKVDTNPRETYSDLNYQITITNLQKAQISSGAYQL